MKRLDIMRKLEDAGMTFQEGGNHTRVYDKDGHFRSTVARHREIDEDIVRKIEKQTGVKLLNK